MAGPVRTCKCGCGEIIPSDAHHRRVYVNDTHKRRNIKRKQRHPGEDHDYSVVLPPEEMSKSYKRGPQYQQFVADGWAESILLRKMSQHEVSRKTGFPQPSISRWMSAYKADRRNAALRAGEFEREDDVFEDLAVFTERFFPDLDVPGFHREWIRSIAENAERKGKLLLLAPQRHGKSEMLIRYCLMRICQDPNISILWVSKTASLAEKMVGQVKAVLEHHPELAEAALGPGLSFKPPRTSGLSWTDSEFTTAARTQVKKTPTMVAIGTGGTIVGLDADEIILDDPQDHIRCMSPTQRDKDREWFFTDFMSRKMEQTALSFIMSRQHMEDLPGMILRDHAEDWEVLTYRAHDPACVFAEAKVDLHHECVLWPEFRSWKWLFGQKKADEAHFERNYMNNPKTDATTYITADDIDRLRDHTRRVGDVPSGCRLVAGIDPAEAKPVAAVLWGFDGSHRHVIDVMEASASVVGLREILSEWPAKYHVRTFAFEKNMAQSWLVDTEVKRLIQSQRLHVLEHYTSRINKQSLAIGPVSMFQRMRGELPEVTIPAGRGEGLDRIDRLVRSWLSFDPDWAGHKHADDDLTMASWFGNYVIDSWEKPPVRQMLVEYSPFGGV